MTSKHPQDSIRGPATLRTALALLAGIAAFGLLAPAAAFASGDGHGFRFTVEGFYIIDFVVLVAALVWIARKPLKKFLLSRRDTIEKEIDEAHTLQTEARSTLDEYAKRMRNLDDELKRIKGRAKEDGESLKKKIIAEGESQAEKLLSDADARVRQEEKLLRQKLISDLVDEAVSLARERVTKELTPSAQRQLVSSYVDHLEGLAGAGQPSGSV